MNITRSLYARYAAMLALVLPLLALGDTAPVVQPVAQPVAQPARNYRLVRQAVAGLKPIQWVFVIVTPEGYVWVATHEKLRWAIEHGVPANATLEWSPGCLREGSEPLETVEEIEALAKFCKTRDVRFVHIPGG